MIRLQQSKIRDYWDQLQAEFRDGNHELKTWSLKSREGSFYARAASDRIFIEGKGIKQIRTIAFPEFQKAANYYNDYLDESPGIKQRIRDEIGYNTPYILTLIHHALEQEAFIPTKTEPKERKKVEVSRPRHYKSARAR